MFKYFNVSRCFLFESLALVASRDEKYLFDVKIQNLFPLDYV